MRGTTEGSLVERLSVCFGRSGHDSPASRIRRFEIAMSTNRCKLYRERRYSCAVFPANGTFEPANAGRRSKAHGQLEQRAAAGRCNGQSSKGSIEGNEERTSEEISRRIKRKGEAERGGRKKKRNEERITLERVNSLVGPKAIKRSIDERTGNERRRKRRRNARREARRGEKEIGRERLSGRGERHEQAERQRGGETRCRDMWEPLDPIVHTDGFERL